MAATKKRATRKGAPKQEGHAMKPGELLQEGVVCSHDSRGVLVGREALPGESFDSPPAGHKAFRFGDRIAFLSNQQAPIPPAGLHKRETGKAGAGSEREAAKSSKRVPRFELTTDNNGEYRAAYYAANGECIWVTSEGYKSKESARHAIDMVMALDKDTQVEDLTG